MTGPAVQTPHVLSGDEWEQQQYAPHRVGGDPKAPLGPGRILTGDEWEQAQAAPSATKLTFPPMPTIARDVTQTPAGAPSKGKKLAPFDITDPTTYANPVLRQVVDPVLEHPFASSAIAAAPFAAAGIPVVGAATSVALGAGMAAGMVYHIAQYGWQKAAELTLSPEDRARAEADPDRISGEAAAVQAAMLGLAPLIHVGAKAASMSSLFDGMTEAGAAGVNEHNFAPQFSEGFSDAVARSKFAADLERGAATARIPSAVDHPEGFQPAQVAGRPKTNPRKVEGLDAPTTATPGRVKPIDTQDASGVVSEDAAARQQVIEDAKNAAERRQEELTRQEALRSLTGVRRRPGGVPPTVAEARAADAERIAGHEGPQSGTSAPYFESPQGAEVLGMMAARHGLADDASPYHPASPLDAAWKAGHDASSGSYPLHPEGFTEGFSMGGALTDNRIPGDYRPPRTPRSEPVSGLETNAVPAGAPEGTTPETVALANALTPSRFRGHATDELVQIARSARESIERGQRQIEADAEADERGVGARDENGQLRRNLSGVSTDDLHVELRRLAELNASDEAAHAGVQEAGYRHDYEELPRTERLGRKGQEDLPDADGTVDAERLAADNKTVSEYRRNQIVRDARTKAIDRLQSEIDARESSGSSSFDFGSNAEGAPGDGVPSTPSSAERTVARAKNTLAQVEREFAIRGVTGDKLAALIDPTTTPAGAPSTTAVEGTGPANTRGLSSGVAERALAHHLADTIGDLPEYWAVSMSDQASRATALLASDPALARRVALGDAPAPHGLLPESVFVAVENKALADGDVATIRDLANGGLTTEATTMGQRIRALGERDADSPVTAIQQIADARSGAVKDSAGAIREAVEGLRAHIESAFDVTHDEWAAFINSLKC